MSTESIEASGVVTSANVTSDVSVVTTTHTDQRTGGPAMGQRILDIRNFSVDYGWGEGAVRAVNNVDLHLNRSTVLGIAGESGSGKSTLVYGFTRLLRAPGVIAGGEALFNL